jgi:hypothetical protein
VWRSVLHVKYLHTLHLLLLSRASCTISCPGGPSRGSEPGRFRRSRKIFLTEPGRFHDGPNQGTREPGRGSRARLYRSLGTSGHDGRVAAVIRAEGAENLAVPLHIKAGTRKIWVANPEPGSMTPPLGGPPQSPSLAMACLAKKDSTLESTHVMGLS